MRNHAQNMVDQPVPDPFIKNRIDHIPDQHSEMLQMLFLFYVQVELYQIMSKIRSFPLAFTLRKAFLTNKKRSETP